MAMAAGVATVAMAFRVAEAARAGLEGGRRQAGGEVQAVPVVAQADLSMPLTQPGPGQG